ncbi:MAG: SDR family NAD(P)-dependent oxidoreductase [Campylobacterota bacterium]
MAKNVLITGCSSGLGLALSKLYLQMGYNVYGISRTKPQIQHENFYFELFDLSNIEAIKDGLTQFIITAEEFEIVFLNAGKLGTIKPSVDVSTKELNDVYELNVYANKEILDILYNIKVDNIIAISSGASKNGSKGWASYSLSKAGLNMLINLYSKELLQTKLIALAPGVIETPMTDYIRFDIDDEKFPSAKRLKEGKIQTATQAANNIFDFIQKVDNFNSGDFIDIRDL